MSALRAGILGVSVWGPGLEGWAASSDILAGLAPYLARPSPPPPPAILAPNERRRTGPVVRLALAVAHEAATMCGLPPATLQSVFASGSGDGVVVGGILEALTGGANQERVVSPTQFHNSVHNAAAGYWSIANASHRPATCLGCHDATFAAGLLKAMVEVACDACPVLLCVYDHPLPVPMHAKRPIAVPFAIGLVLAPPGPGALAHVEMRHYPQADPPAVDGWRDLACGNPVAQGLPLLEALACRRPARISLAYLDGSLELALTP